MAAGADEMSSSAVPASVTRRSGLCWLIAKRRHSRRRRLGSTMAIALSA
jgi:hypothetical protein